MQMPFLVSLMKKQTCVLKTQYKPLIAGKVCMNNDLAWIGIECI